MRLLKSSFIASLLLAPVLAEAAYTTMTIEGVKQANGVWTAAGVMDTQGFVRTTGAVSVMGTTRNLPVAFVADQVASSALLKSASRLAGPVALAAAAYDVYSFFTSNGLASSNDDWIVSDSTIPYPGFYWRADSGGNPSSPTAPQSSPQRAAEIWYSWLSNITGQSYKPVTCTFVSANLFNCKTPNHTGNPVRGYTCTSSVETGSCKPTIADQKFWDSIGLIPFPILSSGFSKLPSLSGQPIPIKDSTFTPFSEWMGDPYFKDGNWWRDRMDVSPSGTTSSPTRVKVDIGPVKIEGATNPETVPDTGPAGGTGGAPQPEKEKPTFCEANPMSIACVELGTLEDKPLEVVELPVNVTYTPWGASNAQCPAPTVIPLWGGDSISVTYQPVCDFVTKLRPLIIALAFFIAGLIITGYNFKKGGE